MEAWFLLLLFPLAWPFISKAIWNNKISWGEMGMQIGVVALCVSALYAITRYSATSDTEIWNGEVTGKEQVKVSCEHSYPCHCRMESCGKNCEEEVCDTCYDHPYDWDWRVYSNVGDFNVSRLDAQGVRQPPRWSVVQKGQPVADARSFTNYIKAAPNSLFHADAEQLKQRFANLLPAYPVTIYDYQYDDRVLAIGVKVPDIGQWNKELPLLLRKLGPTKQANVIILFVNTADESYYEALKAYWLGGKKNDIIVIFGTTEYPKISWVKVLSWTDKELFKVQLQDELFDLKTVDRTKVLAAIEKNTMATFVRKPMNDFKYLMDDYQPPMWALILIGVLGAIGSVGMSIAFYRERYF